MNTAQRGWKEPICRRWIGKEQPGLWKKVFQKLTILGLHSELKFKGEKVKSAYMFWYPNGDVLLKANLL